MRFGRLRVNALSSVAQVVVSSALLFLLYRYLLQEIGSDQVGLWSLVMASTSVAKLSDLGLTGSVTKFVAKSLAIEDEAGCKRVIGTAATSIAVIVGLLLLVVYPIAAALLAWAVPARLLPLAIGILPSSMLSFWLASVGGVFQAALDGHQRYDIRNLVVTLGGGFLYGVAVLFVPSYGLKAVALGQVAQSGFVLLLSGCLLRRIMPAMRLRDMRWSSTTFRGMFSYSAHFQLSALAVLFCEPVTRMLVGRFGGLDSAAFYEMASQMVNKARMLLVAASQSMVAAVAELKERDQVLIEPLYRSSHALMYIGSAILFGGLAALTPTIAHLWLGRPEDFFVLTVYLLCGAYFVNNLEVPAHFVNMGAGDIQFNSAGQLVMAILNVVFGYCFGNLWGALGVVAGSCLALIVGSAVVLVLFHREHRIALASMFSVSHAVLGGLIGLGVYGAMAIPPSNGLLKAGVLRILVFGAPALMGLCLHQAIRPGISRLLAAAGR